MPKKSTSQLMSEGKLADRLLCKANFCVRLDNWSIKHEVIPEWDQGNKSITAQMHHV